MRKFIVTESRESNALFSSLELLALAHEGKVQSYKRGCAEVGASLTELVRASAVMGMIPAASRNFLLVKKKVYILHQLCKHAERYEKGI